MGGNHVAHRFNRLYFCNPDVFRCPISAGHCARADLFIILESSLKTDFSVFRLLLHGRLNAVGGLNLAHVTNQQPARQPRQQRQHHHHMHRGAYKSPQRRFPFAGAGQAVNDDIDRRQRRRAHCRHPAEPSPDMPQISPRLGPGLALKIKNGTQYTSTVMMQPKNSAPSTSATITGVSRASLVSETNFTIFRSLLIGGSLKLSGCFGLINRVSGYPSSSACRQPESGSSRFSVRCWKASLR